LQVTFSDTENFRPLTKPLPDLATVQVERIVTFTPFDASDFDIDNVFALAAGEFALTSSGVV
jgi:hypothetical protein